MGERRGKVAVRRSRWLTASARRRAAGLLLAAMLAAWVLASCKRTSAPSDLRVKAGYLAFGNVELHRDGPDRIKVRSSITDVQYAVLVPFVATAIAALASAYAYRLSRRRRRRSDWALPLGSAAVTVLLGVVGWSAMTIDTVIDEQAKTVRVEQHRFWGAIPKTAQLDFAQIDDVRVLYRSRRGAYCAAVVRLSPDDGSEIPLFRFVDIFTAELNLGKCEHLRHRLARSLGVKARDEPEERTWW